MPEMHTLLVFAPQGVVVNVLKPKTALFFLAFLPQFVGVGRRTTRRYGGGGVYVSLGATAALSGSHDGS